jgi:hypothetical protein
MQSVAEREDEPPPIAVRRRTLAFSLVVSFIDRITSPILALFVPPPPPPLSLSLIAANRRRHQRRRRWCRSFCASRRSIRSTPRFLHSVSLRVSCVWFGDRRFVSVLTRAVLHGLTRFRNHPVPVDSLKVVKLDLARTVRDNIAAITQQVRVLRSFQGFFVFSFSLSV